MNMKEGTLETLPQDIPEVQTAQAIQAQFPSQGSTLEVVVKTTGDSSEVVPALQQLADEAAKRGTGRRRRRDPNRLGTARRRCSRCASPYADGSDRRRNSALETGARRPGAEHCSTGFPDREWAVGGDIAESADCTKHQRDELPWVIGFVLLLTLLMMGVTFRSVAIALVTTVLNLASVAAAFGVLSAGVPAQLGRGAAGLPRPAASSSTGSRCSCSSVLVGLSMDYHVFVLSRIREGVDRGLPPKVAVEAGVTETAGVVTSAALP